jgi:ABC-type antimicrobial peptide transport system permease subunit
MAYAVARRTGEIGVRMALGALPRDVLAMVLRDSGRVAPVGIIIGAAVSWLLGRFIESQLFGIQAANPAIFTGSAGILAAVALLAALYPAWKASRTDPLSALKYE